MHFGVKNFKMNRKQVILLALIVALGAAILITWRFSDEPAAKATIKTSGTASVSGTDDGYFAAARLAREQNEAKADELLSGLTSGSTATAAVQQSAKSEVDALNKEITTEKSIESLVKAKGFSDCLALINDTRISIVVRPKNGTTLSDDDVSELAELVMQQAKITADNIVIIPYTAKS